MATEDSPQEYDHPVVWISHRNGEKCAQCGEEITSGNFIQVNRRDGLRCITCAGYGDMYFLPAGDAKLTRLATSLSKRKVIVMKWVRARKRHERQGILVDDKAYDAAMESLPKDHEWRRVWEIMNR